MNEFAQEVLIFAAENDIRETLYWDENLNFYILCSDFFFWGTSDLEEITPNNFYLLKESVKDAGEVEGPYLFCSRARKMRPQGACYKTIDKELWPLFDACGPEREIDIVNPRDQNNEYLYKRSES